MQTAELSVLRPKLMAQPFHPYFRFLVDRVNKDLLDQQDQKDLKANKVK